MGHACGVGHNQVGLRISRRGSRGKQGMTDVYLGRGTMQQAQRTKPCASVSTRSEVLCGRKVRCLTVRSLCEV